MAMARRIGPLVAALCVAAYWLHTNPLPALVIFGATGLFVGAERLAGLRARAGEIDDLVHLTVTTVLVRLTGVEIVVAGLRDLRSGWTVSELPFLPRVAIVVVIFDFVGYLHHRAMHQSPLLWPVHRVHHAIERVDVLVKARRHPLDDVLLVVVFGATGFALGVDSISLLAVAAIATLHGMVVHSNVIVRPCWADGLIVTPWVHHRHHGVDGQDGDYAGLLSVWDRLLGTRGTGAPTPAGAGDALPTGDWVDQMLHPVRHVGGRRPSDQPSAVGIQGPTVAVGQP